MKCGSQIYTQIGGTYINNSEIETGKVYGTVFSYGNTYIDNSTINCVMFSKQADEGLVTIKNSKIYSQSQISFFSTNDDYAVIFQNSEIESGEIYIPSASSIIEGCTINSTSDLYLSKNAIIKNTKATLQGGISKCGVNGTGTLIIEDSDILGSFCVGRSNDTTSKTIIKNTSIKSNNWSDFNSELLFENCKFDFPQSVYFFQDTSINNSEGNFSDITIAYDALNISNSNLKITNEKSTSEKLFPLYTKNDLKINNSNIIINNIKNEKKAASIQGNLILDDKIMPIDNQNTKLNLIRLEDDAEDRSTCSICYDANKPIYIFTYEDNSYSKYVQLATTKTITFKVKNGTWLDGTTDDIKLDYLYGEKIEVEKLPDQVKELLSSKMGVWSMDLNNLDPTKDLEIEFKYDLINPDTSNKIVLLLVFVVILVVVLRNKKIYKKEF